jgi:DNA end-binding protein Ku
MKGKGTVGVGRVVISKRERAIILEPFGKGIRAMTLRYPYEVRKEDEYFADIPDTKVTGEMLKLAEHIVETKTGDFEPDEFVDRYENAVVELLKQKQAGKPITRNAADEPRRVEGNIIDLLKKSMELEEKRGKGRTKAPPLQPTMPKGAKKKRARAS